MNDEQARLLSGVVREGAARSTEEAADQAARSLPATESIRRPVHTQVDNLADLFARSPFRGLDIEFERHKPTPYREAN